MARVDDCSFCGRNFIGTCGCILEFGQRLQKKIVEWNLKNPAKPLPLSIVKASKDVRWKLYAGHLEAERARAGELQKASRHAFKLRERLQAIADKDMEGFDAGFHVLVTVKCSKVACY